MNNSAPKKKAIIAVIITASTRFKGDHFTTVF